MKFRILLRLLIAIFGISFLTSCATSGDPIIDAANSLKPTHPRTAEQQEYDIDYSYFKKKGYSDAKAKHAATAEYFNKYHRYPDLTN